MEVWFGISGFLNYLRILFHLQKFYSNKGNQTMTLHESWAGEKFQGYKHDLILWYNKLWKFLLWQRNQFSSFPTQLYHLSWRVHIYCDHINLQTVHICCQVIISFFRWFTHTFKWWHCFRDGLHLLLSDRIILHHHFSKLTANNLA